MPLSIDFRFYKFVAAAAGYYYGGIIGAVAAYFLARELIDNRDRGVDIFELSLLRLSSLLVKADGKIENQEIVAVRNFFIKTFGRSKADRLFKAIKNNPPISSNIDEIVLAIRSRIEPSKLFLVIQFLFSIAVADRELALTEEKFIFDVGEKLGFSKERLIQIKAQFLNYNAEAGKDDLYYLKKLGLAPGATKQEIKDAYKSMAKTFHPDKLAGVDIAIKKIAEEKFKEIKEAYENLTKNPKYV